jgi:hypothetical protein
MRLELFIEGQVADVSEEFSTAFTYAIDDFKEFGFRHTNFSKTMIMPGTATNKKLFGHIFDVGSGNFVNDANPNVGYDFNAAKSAKALLFLGGIQSFKGVLRLNEIIVDRDEIEFEVNLYGELGGLVSKLSDGMLSDLDFSSYNHTFQPASVAASWTSALGSGVYYGLIDYGYSFDKIRYPIETFRPALHVREYISKMFAAAGYTFASDFLDTDYFKKLIVPYNGQIAGQEVETVLQSDDTSLLNQPYSSMYVGLPLNPSVSFFEYNSTTRVFTWRRQEAAKMKFSVLLQWQRFGTFASSANWIVICLKNITDNTSEIFYQAQPTGTIGIVNASFSYEVQPNKQYQLAAWSGYSANGGNTSYSGIDFLVEGQPTVVIPLANGDTVNVNKMIPRNVTQADFLKWIVKMFNLYIYEDKDKANHVIIEPFIDFYNGATVEDWDAKLDRSKPFRYRPLSDHNSRSYEFKYKEDSDYYNDRYKQKFNEGYGSFIFDSGFEFLNSKSTVEVGFSPTPLVQFANSDRVVPAIFKKNSEDFERVAHNPRILFRTNALVPCQTWYMTYYNGGSYVEWAQLGGYPYCGHLDDPDAPTNDLNFGSPREFYFSIVTGYLSANLFNVFYSWYMSEITDKDSKLLIGDFHLNAKDIHDLDFSRPKYINGQLWRLNKIIDFSTDQPSPTKCELLKVIDLDI